VKKSIGSFVDVLENAQWSVDPFNLAHRVYGTLGDATCSIVKCSIHYNTFIYCVLNFRRR